MGDNSALCSNIFSVGNQKRAFDGSTTAQKVAQQKYALTQATIVCVFHSQLVIFYTKRSDWELGLGRNG